LADIDRCLPVVDLDRQRDVPDHAPARPVWLFSMDSPGFWAAPLTTGALEAFHRVHGRQPCSFERVHFRDAAAIAHWRADALPRLLERCATTAPTDPLPVLGFSVYTWNAAEFLDLARAIRAACPTALLVAGGPHVQQAEDYLGSEAFEVIVLGEGEVTFSALLDAPGPGAWPDILGIAFRDGARIRRTPPRPRIADLGRLPSALDVVPLADAAGNPLYDAVAYETSRGCPFRCAFCEWGTGAIGTRMVQFPLDRVRRDWATIVGAGIRNLWLADSNFGALREDLDKARFICELKEQSGLPVSFATSWSKKHSPRVQEIVLLLHRHGLLPHYQLALQTLTPEALRLSNRQNMQANEYRPIARRMAEAGVPIAAELIWGLPGDSLADFERNLDTLLAEFPGINIFGYTLLPGTEFYAKRDEYRIQTLPVAGYGKANGEYVIGCHTFDRAEGMAGYFLITAHTLLVRGHLLPLTTRYLALRGDVRVSALLRALLEELLRAFAAALPDLDAADHMAVYEARSRIFLALLAERERCYETLSSHLSRWLATNEVADAQSVLAVLAIDRACCPRAGQQHRETHTFPCGASAAKAALEGMQLPEAASFAAGDETVTVEYPGGIGDLIREPDAGGWAQGRFLSADGGSDAVPAPQTDASAHQIAAP
jgi:radical SAM superfamily enzyme YgiQ (UPF0313 family)